MSWPRQKRISQSSADNELDKYFRDEFDKMILRKDEIKKLFEVCKHRAELSISSEASVFDSNWIWQKLDERKCNELVSGLQQSHFPTKPETDFPRLNGA